MNLVTTWGLPIRTKKMAAVAVLIVERAGGKLSSFYGDDNFIFGKTIIASSANLYTDFFNVIDESFNK